MREISQRARDLISSLYEDRLLVRLLGKPRLDSAALEELVRCDEPAAIPFLTRGLLSGSRDDAFAVAEAVARLLRRTTSADLVALDELMRRTRLDDYRFSEEWCALKPAALARFEGLGALETCLLQLSTFHWSGFVREEAVRRLSLITNGMELPFLLLRLNDWVAPVRSAATQAVLARINSSYATHFVSSLDLVFRLRSMKRADHGELLEGVSRILALPDAHEAMFAMLRSAPRELRRCCFRTLIDGQSADLPRVLLAASKVDDPLVRLWIVRRVSSPPHAEQHRAILAGLLADSSGLVRREALATWATSNPEQSFDALFNALLDRSASVRGEARARLRDRRIDFAALYRDAIAGARDRRLVSTMSGLAETGVQADAASLSRFLSHPSARVRCAAVRGVMRLDGDRQFDRIADCLADASRSVSSQARRSLIPYAARIGLASLRERFEVESREHVRRNLLCLFAALPKWDSIGELLRIAVESDATIASLAQGWIQRWNARYNRTQVAPSREQLQRLESALENAGSRIDPKQADLLRFTIRSYARD